MTAERIDPEELTPSNPDGKATSAPEFYDKVIVAINGHADLLDEYSVAGFGAIPDDSTDNTAAIQAAINTASALGGGRVYIPAGVYRTGKLALKSNVSLCGDGAISYSQNVTLGATILKLNNSTDTELINCNGVSGAGLEGLTLTGSAAGGGTAVGVRVTGGKAIKIDNCRITHFTSHGIYGHDNGIHRILNCIISYNTGVGIHFDFGVADSMVRGCIINANGSHGVYLGGGSNMHFFIGNRIEWNTGNGLVAFQALEITFVGNQLDRNQKAGLRIGGTASNWTISGNRFKRNGPAEVTSTERANVYMESLSNSLLCGNTFGKGADDDGSGTLSPDYGVSYLNCTDIKIDDNALKGSTVAGTFATEISSVGGNTNVSGIRNTTSDTGRNFGCREMYLGGYAAGGGAVPMQLRHNATSYGAATSAELLYLGNPNDSSDGAKTKGFLFRIDKPASPSLHAALVLSEFQGFDSVNTNTFTDSNWLDGYTFSAGQFTANAGAKIGSAGTMLTQAKVYTPTLTPSAVAASTTAEQTFTVTGLTTADTVHINPPASLGDGLGIVGVRVSAADTLAIRFANNTAGALTPASGAYRVVGIRS